MRKALFLVLAVILVSFHAAPAWAWGCSGHEVVALIAHQELQSLDKEHHTQVLPEVERLLALEDRNYPKRYCGDLNLDAMAFWATWADDHRSQDPATGPWHYWDIPLSVPSATLGQYCDEGCVVKALEQEIAIVRDRTRPDAERATALLYVIHFVGDMHQPLHEEDNNDRGGNCVPVSFLSHAAEQRPNGGYGPNLHGVWDTELVETIGGIDRKSPGASGQVSGFAARLAQEDGALIRRSAIAPVDLVGWANQTHEVARTVAYGDLQPPIAPDAAVTPGADCGATAANYFARHEVASAAYVTEVTPTVERQLSLAGARLADVLYTSLR
ncbi:MAG TPA: S1/P1 nuclease [Terracidiphilus sp.]|nr:S1/P1 nuclease [Terracidiphilus sp.]